MASSASPAQIFVRENYFYRRTAIALALLIIAGFALFSIAGLTDVTVMPRSAHLHGLVMGSWLLLFVVQSFLGAGRDLSLHRKLGWFGAGLAVLAVLTAWNTGFVTTALDRAPPIFYTGYFLALNLITPIVFAAFVVAAIIMRKRTDWHRRLMLAAIIVVTEPALGRLTMLAAIPLMGGPEVAFPFLTENRWVIPMAEFVVQMGIVAAIMWFDRRIRGSVHPALKLLAIAIPAFYAAVWSVGSLPAFVQYAEALKGSAL